MTPRTLPLLLAALVACNDDGAPTPAGAGDGADGADSGEAWRPDVVCPGDASCLSNEGPLRAGAAKRVITPPCFETWENLDGGDTYSRSNDAYKDCGCDRVCPDDPDWPGADEGENDGVFQAVWMAGFQNARPAMGVHDDLWARAVVFESGDTRVGLVSLDVVGFFYDDVVRVREAAAAADLDLLVVQSTHNHEGPDTMGQWGPDLTTPGKDRAYVDWLIGEAATAVVEAAERLEPATLTAVAVDTAAPFGDKGTRNLVRDSRDPVVIDQDLYAAHFADASGATIATIVNWGNHPETLADENFQLTSDYPHYLREAVEGGVTWGDTRTDGLGGICVFSSAAVGGMMTPLGVTVTDGDAIDHAGNDFAKAEAIGKLTGELAILAIRAATPATSPTVSLAASQMFIPAHNEALRLAHALGVLDRELHHYDPSLGITDLNRPDVLTEVGLIDLGPIRMLAIPGELLPELAIGGYDGSRVNTTEDVLVDPGNPNPPDLDQAPGPPYYSDLMGAQHNWILGLANDELGYLIPPYDYVLDPSLPYLDEAEGDHYEETNSLGPDAVPMISDMVERLTGFQR